jgi:regulation of enolase protein 1 (concanavalin A-like superfamily)
MYAQVYGAGREDSQHIRLAFALPFSEATSPPRAWNPLPQEYGTEVLVQVRSGRGAAKRFLRGATAVAVVFALWSAGATAQTLPPGWTTADVGAPLLAGSASFGDGAFSLSGAGANPFGTADQLMFVYRQLVGDGDIPARLASLSGIQTAAEAGVMIRESLAAGSKHGFVRLSGAGTVAMKSRSITGGNQAVMSEAGGGAPVWLRLERRASMLNAFRSADGVSWMPIGTVAISMSPTVYVGLAVTSGTAITRVTAGFDNVNLSPAVSLSAPANGATFTAPATLTLSATANDADGTVTAVDFYAGQTLIGSAATTPYSVTWNNVPTGQYSLTAVARDDGSATTTSAARTITVTAPNQPPAVSLTAPANGATFTAPATLTVSANASDPDGAVTAVEFYAGTTLIGSDTASPYSATWTNVPAGTYALTAVARDDDSVTTTSAARAVTVADELPGGWTASDIGGPAAGGSARYADGTYTLQGAGEVVGTWDRFHFVYQPVTGEIDIRARVVSIEAVHQWSKAGVMLRETLAPDAAYGLMFISASSGSAWSRRESTGASRVHTDGTAVSAPYWVRLERRGSAVTASQSADGVTWMTIGTMTMSQPTIHVGLAVASSDTNQLATGVFDQLLVATPVVNQLPTVSLTAPAHGATFAAPATITVSASASDADGTIASVDFYAGQALIGSDATSPYSVTWNNVPAGTYALTAVARDDDSATTTSAARSIAVTASNQVPMVSLTAPANGATFTAPAAITVSATASDADGTVTTVEFYADHTLLGSDATSPYSVTWSSVQAGSYQLTAVARDEDAGMTVSASRAVMVNDPQMPGRALFTASGNHDSAVDYYVVEIFPEGADPNGANAVAAQNIGKPPVVNGECEADVRSMIETLPPGSYIATVTAFGSAGSARSAFAAFTR